MGFERVAVLVALAGCFRPAPEAGAPCAENGTCPNGLVCVGTTCELPGTRLDDAAIDAPDIDAPRDAPIDAAPLLWSGPQPIPGVNTASGETDPSMTTDRKTIVFGRSGNLFIGTRNDVTAPFTVTELTGLNSANVEQSPEISPDGNTLYFVSEAITAGDGDIYVSVRTGGSFTTATRVAELSVTGTDDGDIAISPDGLTAIVARGTLFRATRATTTSAWGTPVSLGAIFGTSPASPALTAAGDLYFHADATRNLYVARKMGTSFGMPTAITELNTTGRDAAPFISADEHYLWFERNGELYESTK